MKTNEDGLIQFTQEDWEKYEVYQTTYNLIEFFNKLIKQRFDSLPTYYARKKTNPFGENWDVGPQQDDADTHQFKMIGLRKIKEDSAEDLLREIVNELGNSGQDYNVYIKAKRFLEKRKK